MELSTWFTKHSIKSSINNKWKILMERVNSIDLGKDPTRNTNYSDFNKKANYYVIENIFIKHYGFDAIIVPPYGKSLNDFRKLLPSISMIYRGEVIAEYSKTKSSFYMRCHLDGLEINDMDNIKFKWYSMFADTKMRNINGETFSLGKSENIYHPTKKDKVGNKELIGYRFEISIPSGLSYDSLEGSIVDLNKLFGICSLHFDDSQNKTIIEIMNKKVPDEERYEPIKVKPYELYVGMTHYYKPIILNFKISPNALWGGQAGSGKTVSMMMAMLNLILHNDENAVNLYITMLSDKQDLKIFKKTKQCKYYANTYQDALKELLFLSGEVSRRNKLFDKADEYGGIVNVHEYNEKFKNKKLPLIYYCVDEIASFSVDGTDTNQQEKNMKKRCEALMWKINREGRSAGIYCLLASQRGSVANMSPEIKSNLGNQVCFYFSNIASAMTILGDGELAKLAIKQRTSREFIAVTNGTFHGKTLHLTPDMMKDLLKPLMENDKQFMNLDSNGHIVKNQEITINEENIAKTTENEPKIKENKRKVIDFTKKTETFKQEDKPKSRWEEYQERRKDKK